MCIEGVWLSIHQRGELYYSGTGSVTLNHNPRRCGLIITATYFVNILKENGSTLVTLAGLMVPVATTGTSTNNVAPTGNTSTTNYSNQQEPVAYFLSAKELGEHLQSGLTIQATGGYAVIVQANEYDEIAMEAIQSYSPGK